MMSIAKNIDGRPNVLHGKPPNTSHVNILNTYVNSNKHKGLKLTQLEKLFCNGHVL